MGKYLQHPFFSENERKMGAAGAFFIIRKFEKTLKKRRSNA